MNNNSPISEDTQRMENGVDRRRSIRESGFHPADYTVSRISKAIGEPFVDQHHYSKSHVLTVRAYGLHRDGELLGVALFSMALNNATIHNLWGHETPLDAQGQPRPYRGENWLQPGLPTLDGKKLRGPVAFAQALRHAKADKSVKVRGGALELGRFILRHEVPGRAETWFLGECFELLQADGFHGIVSFADPFPRYTRAGLKIFPGHVGWIYQAHNAVYTGRGTPGVLHQLDDGASVNKRSMVKVLNMDNETGGPKVISRLVALGADVPQRGEDLEDWLEQALVQVGVTEVDHPGNYRYAWTIGTRREKRDSRVLTAAQSYPKTVDSTVADAFLADDMEIAS